MDENVRELIQKIKDEAVVLLSGLPSDKEVTLKCLETIADAAMKAFDIVEDKGDEQKGAKKKKKPSGPAAGSSLKPEPHESESVKQTS